MTLIVSIKFSMGAGDHMYGFVLRQQPHQRGANHAAMACHIDAFSHGFAYSPGVVTW